MKRSFRNNRFGRARMAAACLAVLLLAGCGGADAPGVPDEVPENRPGVEEPAESKPDESTDPDPKDDDADADLKAEDLAGTMALPGQVVAAGSGVRMTVRMQETGRAVKIAALPGDPETIYAAFRFVVENASETALPLGGQTQPQARKWSRALAQTEEADPYADWFDGAHRAVDFSFSLNGAVLPAEDAACRVQLYEGDTEQEGTTLQPGWRAEWDVVLKVPAEWADPQKPLSRRPIKLEYTLPAQGTDTAPVRCAFALTSDGQAPAYTAVPGVQNVRYNTVKAELNGQSGELLLLDVCLENTTKTPIALDHTRAELGNLTAGTAQDGVQADELFRNSGSAGFTAQVTTTNGDAGEGTAASAVDSIEPVLAVTQKADVTFYLFVPESSGQWTAVSLDYEGIALDLRVERTVEPGPEEPGGGTGEPAGTKTPSYTAVGTGEYHLDDAGRPYLKMTFFVRNTTPETVEFGNALNPYKLYDTVDAARLLTEGKTSREITLAVAYANGLYKKYACVAALEGMNARLEAGESGNLEVYAWIDAEPDGVPTNWVYAEYRDAEGAQIAVISAQHCTLLKR